VKQPTSSSDHSPKTGGFLGKEVARFAFGDLPKVRERNKKPRTGGRGLKSTHPGASPNPRNGMNRSNVTIDRSHGGSFHHFFFRD
jgi:hypothetical protein